MKKQTFSTSLVIIVSALFLSSCQTNIPQQVQEEDSPKVAQTEESSNETQSEIEQDSLGSEVLGDSDEIAQGKLEGITIKTKDGNFITASVEDINQIKLQLESNDSAATLKELIDNQKAANIDTENNIIQGVNNLYANSRYEWAVYINGQEVDKTINNIELQLYDSIYLIYQKK